VCADVTFFESVLYFSPQVPITISKNVSPSTTVSLSTQASIVSSPIPPVETQDPLQPSQFGISDTSYTHRLKVPTSELVQAIPLQ